MGEKAAVNNCAEAPLFNNIPRGRKMPLSELQKQRYCRQLMLEGIGEAGQERLLNARVLIIGAGGLGSTVAYYLTAAGVGKICLVDSDQVEISNLQRQILHFTPDIGRRKVESAQEKLRALNPDVEIIPLYQRVTRENVFTLVDQYDLTIAAVDNIIIRYLLNEACFKLQKPLVEGAVGGFNGHITTFMPPTGPCYQCLFPNRVEREAQKNEPPGLIGVLPGIIGIFQANEALKIILKIGRPLLGQIGFFNALAPDLRTVEFSRNAACPICKP